MTIQDIAQLIVPVATAIGVLVPVLRSRSDIKKRLDSLEISILQLTLHDEHLPDYLRLASGKRYIDLGGNGPTKVYYEELEADYRKKIRNKTDKKP